ncbi:MAG: hypothetical protein ACOCO5_07030, partial [Segatella copri]
VSFFGLPAVIALCLFSIFVKQVMKQDYIKLWFICLDSLLKQSITQKKQNAELAEKMRDTRDMLKELYGWSDSGSSSMRSSAVGITEQTADYIASYLNATRADVSVIRQLEGVYFAKFDVTTLAQLEQLTMISENTLRNADAAVAIQTAVYEIKDMINKSQSGIKPIYVNVK